MINNIGNRNPWLGLRLLNRSGQDALGARIAVIRSQGPALWRRGAYRWQLCVSK